ncbi:MAG: hypothetical protein Q8N00_06555 [Nitrospirota bacterium]|nr:hypothetical protein [Nitrospirota bacterium]MDP3598378.1 hypothetical protein [Nitrospirota bacterium]
MSQLATQSPPKVTPESKVTPEYREAVIKMADEHRNERFLNDSPEHAKLLADLMIGRAEEADEVSIYSKSLPMFCYADALRNCKSQNIRVILDDASGRAELPEDLSSRMKIRILDIADGAHFFTAKDSFRLEMDHEKAKAVANFNEPEAVQKLRSRFEHLWASAAQ